jgi:tRNA dimethylallyltransferase
VPDDEREALKARIDARVDEMLVAGAAEEVARARDAGPIARTAQQAIGVRELSAVLDGELGLDAAAARMKARTRVLARRQLTWMRKLPAAAQVPAAGRPPDAVAKDILALVEARPW